MQKLFEHLTKLKPIAYRNPKLSLKAVQKALESIRGNPQNTSAKVAYDLALEILETLIYFEFESTVEILLREYKVCAHEKKIVGFFEKVLSYKDDSLKVIGFDLHLKVAKRISKFSDKEKILYSPIITKALSKSLELEIDASQMTDYNQFSIVTKTFLVTDSFIKLRAESLKQLEYQFDLLKGDIHKRVEIIQLINQAISHPLTVSLSEEVEDILVSNIEEVLCFYKEKITSNQLSFSEIKEIENDVLFLKKRYKDNLPVGVEELLAQISFNEEYVLYDTLIGFQNEFLTGRNNEDLIEKTRKIIESFSIENYEKWIRIVTTISKEDYIYGEYYRFAQTLVEITKFNTSLAEVLYKEEIKGFEKYKGNILIGLWGEGLQDKVSIFIDEWLESSKGLKYLAFVLEKLQGIETGYVEKTFKRALLEFKGNRKISNEEKSDLKTCLYSCIRILLDMEGHNRMQVSFIEEVGKLGLTGWVDVLWVKDRSFGVDLSRSQMERVLNSIVSLPDIGYHIEPLLGICLKNYPRLFVAYFRNRIAFSLNKKEDLQYSAVPFNFDTDNFGYESLEFLELVDKLILSKKNIIYKLHGSRLISLLYSPKSKCLSQFLENLLVNGRERDALRIISDYGWEGRHLEHWRSFSRKFVEHCNDTNAWIDFFISTTSTGVVTGEYGFVEAYSGMRSIVESWYGSGKDKRYLDFLDRFIQFLTVRINSEQKRADVEMTLMKKAGRM